jgi:hypothetical protein
MFLAQIRFRPFKNCGQMETLNFSKFGRVVDNAILAFKF